MLKTYQFKTHCKGGSHFARTHDKTKVNVLMAASEMVFKFIELHYVGWNNSSHPSWTAYYISLADASGKGRYIEVLAVIRTIIRKRDTVWSGIPCSKCCALGHHFLSCTEGRMAILWITGDPSSHLLCISVSTARDQCQRTDYYQYFLLQLLLTIIIISCRRAAATIWPCPSPPSVGAEAPSAAEHTAT